MKGTRLRTRTVLAAGACVAALAAGAGAAAAGGHGHRHGDAHARAVKAHVAKSLRGGGIAAAASYLGLTPAQLRADLETGKTLAQVADATPGKSADGLVAALTAAAKAKLDALVARGKLTAAQETALLDRLGKRIDALVHRPHVAARAAKSLYEAAVRVAAGYLGLTPARLRADLKSGKTLAQIADATPGKSADGLVAALTVAVKAKLDAAVAAGKLTAAQESALLAGASAAIAAAVHG
jgi:hypothetical protein